MANHSCVVSVLGRLIGMKNVGTKGTITSAGWAKYQGTNGGSVYKNRIAWNHYDSRAQKEVSQFATITCFGKRYDWISENIDKCQVFVSGDMFASAYLNTTNNTPSVGLSIDVDHLNLVDKGTNGSQGPQQQTQQQYTQPQQTSQAEIQGPPPQAQSEVPQKSMDEELPF